MKQFFCAFGLTVVTALSSSFAVAGRVAEGTADNAAVPVIVVFQPETPFHQFDAIGFINQRVQAFFAERYLDRGVVGAVFRLEGLHGFQADRIYSNAVRGFAGRLTPAQIAALRSEPTVAYIEADQPVHIDAQSMPWGIERIGTTVSSTIAGNGSGAVDNVNAYVIDTGIAAHADLNLVQHLNFIGGTNTDCHGHGTHVAGTIAARDNVSSVVGVAPGAKLYGLKVMGCDGAGTMSAVIKAIDWVTANAVKPAVANMSLSGGLSQTLDDAVRRSANSGVLYALAAGNGSTDACTRSPARAGFDSTGIDNGVVTAAAVDSLNDEAGFSNYGKCVGVWAPGVSVVSTIPGGGVSYKSGTSMAAPHVAGAAALYLSKNPAATAAQVEAALRVNRVGGGTVSKNGDAVQVLRVSAF